jgi:16S rRNA (adenine1518-N6/adenine1519-N6)-dimethyltransferase
MSERLPYAKKNLGQHFLKEQKVISAITEDYASEAGSIIEIGPGPGALTQPLAALNLPMAVVERDWRFIDDLKTLLGEKRVVHNDALEVNLEELIEEQELPAPVWLVSNLPYNVSTPLLVKFLKIPAIKMMTLMFQREVAQKVFDFTEGKNAMGSLMALSQTYCDVKLLIQAPPGCFQPPPEVHSTVLSFKRIEEPVIALSELGAFEQFLRELFSFKRKQVQKVLRSSFEESLVHAALLQCGLKPDQRAESFTLDQVQQLFNALRRSS